MDSLLSLLEEHYELCKDTCYNDHYAGSKGKDFFRDSSPDCQCLVCRTRKGLERYRNAMLVASVHKEANDD